jgi:hypothetical protein
MTFFRAARAALVVAVLAALAPACGGEPAPADLLPTGPNDATILQLYEADYPKLGDDHHAWHSTTLRGDPDYGIKFLRFHRALIGAYDDWRAAHGYAPLVPWDPGTPIPRDVPHPGRASENPSANDPLCRRPVWLTVTGGANGERDPDFGAASLQELTSSNQLGRSIDSTSNPRWHVRVHDGVGGDMAHPHRLIYDPIFWRWHKFIDTIWAEYEAAVPDAPDL